MQLYKKLWIFTTAIDSILFMSFLWDLGLKTKSKYSGQNHTSEIIRKVIECCTTRLKKLVFGQLTISYSNYVTIYLQMHKCIQLGDYPVGVLTHLDDERTMNNGLPVAVWTLINLFLVTSKVYETNCKKKGILNCHLSVNDKILLLGMSDWQQRKRM